ncbi:MAG TPA: hypothetical protein VFM94_11620 [Solirubrobacterales bacterium]|nr:hypothetical protein [Solirubrobacterales bacterium]
MAQAAKTREFKEVFGSASQPSFVQDNGLAVDPASGDLLVIDAGPGAKTISRFKPNGEADPFPALGSNVIDAKKGAGGQECIAEPSSCDQTPQNGFGFGDANEVQISIAPPGSAASTAGNIYVSQAGARLVDIFASDGHYLGQLTKAGVVDFGEPCGVAVDQGGGIYVADFLANKVYKFAPSANPPLNTDVVGEFSALIEHPCTLAAGAGPTAGSIFAAGYNPLPGGVVFDRPVSRLNRFTGAQELAIAGRPTTATVDPGTGNLLVAQLSEIAEYNSAGSQIGPSIKLDSTVEGITADSASNVYVSRAGMPSVEIYGPLVQLEPQIAEEWVSGVGTIEATLKAKFGVEEAGTSYHFDYGTDTSYGQSTPTGAVAGEAPATANLFGLQAGTTYHWRVVASNIGGAAQGPDRTFHTPPLITLKKDCPNQALRIGASSFLPDCRAFEMVSPIDKNGAGVEPGVITDDLSHTALDQSSGIGEGLTYTSKQAFGDASSSPYASQYLAQRDHLSGWANHSLNAPRKGFAGLDRTPRDMEYKAFTKDLSEAWLVHEGEPPLATCGPPDSPALYRRDNVNDVYEALHCTPSLPINRSIEGVQGISADSCRTVFRSSGALTPDAKPTGFYQLYESSCEDPLRLVSVLPNGKACAVDSSAGSSPLDLSGVINDGRTRSVQNAFAEDAGLLYWSCGTTLYLRRDPDLKADGDEKVVRVSEECFLGSCIAIPAEFQAASSDGARGLYKASDSLWRYDPQSGISHEVATGMQRSLLGASEDARRAYFTSDEVLTEAPNSIGDKAIENHPNLYFYEENGDFHFVGTLSERDLTSSPRQLSSVHHLRFRRASRVTPDGLHAAFISTAPLTRYDNIDADSGKVDAEVYVYDASARGGKGETLCVSCSPTGARPYGTNINGEPGDLALWAAAWLPGWQTQLYQGRPLSKDGSRLFFNSVDSLVYRDTNNRQDVYEWERGSSQEDCEKSKGAEIYVSSAGGCLSLISSGQDLVNATFVDADLDGSDVFIRTGESLLSRDPGLVDIYDARIGGGFPPPAHPEPECEGEACQSPPPPPILPDTPSFSYSGPGNSKPGRKGKGCPRGKRKVRHNGKAHCSPRRRKRQGHRADRRNAR